MKTITLIYSADEASQAALNEIEYIKNKYSDIIIKNKINFITKTNIEYLKIDKNLNTYPTLFFIEDFKVEKTQGYDLEKLNNNYWEYFLDNFNLRDLNPFPSWTWNEKEWKWEAPIPNLKEPFNDYTWDEETKSWMYYQDYLKKLKENNSEN